MAREIPPSAIGDHIHTDGDLPGFANQTSLPQIAYHDDGPVSHMGWVIIIVVVSVAFTIFISTVVYLEKRRAVASRLARRAAREPSRQERKPRSQRYVEIEEWLVSKRVEAHDSVCDAAMRCRTCFTGALPNHSSIALADDDDAGRSVGQIDEASSVDIGDIEHQASHHSCSNARSCVHDDEDSHHNECSICFDAFREGEIVSWSPEPRCDHAFHHHCIKQWLLKKKECPFCREIFLPIDRTQDMNLKKINELILAKHQLASHSYYCLEHGVVRLPSGYAGRRMEKSDLDAISTKCSRTPGREELAKIRGIQEESCKETNELDLEVPSATVLSSSNFDSENGDRNDGRGVESRE